MSSAEGHQDGHGAGALALWGEAEGPEEEKVSRGPNDSPPVQTRRLLRRWHQVLQCCVVGRWETTGIG